MEDPVPALRDKVVIVTGAGQGLGRAYAEAAAAAGASVLVNDIDADRAAEVAARIESAGGRAAVSAHSVSDPAAVDDLVRNCVRELGTITGLVNNAGIYPHDTRAWEDRPDRIRAMFDVNVLGTIFCTTAVVRELKRTGAPGSVLNVTSGTHLGVAGTAIYGATKGAIASLTYTWALDLLEHGIRVNALSPVASTRMKRSPTDHDLPPESIAPMAVFLLCDAAASVTGQVVRIAGGRIGLLTPPRVGQMSEPRDWSYDAIAEEFATTWGARLEPVGRDLVDVSERGGHG